MCKLLQTCHRAASFITQRHHRIDTHSPLRRNETCSYRNRNQQYGHAAKRERIIRAHAEKLAPHKPRQCQRNSNADHYSRQRELKVCGAAKTIARTSS